MASHTNIAKALNGHKIKFYIHITIAAKSKMAAKKLPLKSDSKMSTKFEVARRFKIAKQKLPSVQNATNMNIKSKVTTNNKEMSEKCCQMRQQTTPKRPPDLKCMPYKK